MNRKIMAAFISIVILLVVGAEASALQSQTSPSFHFQDSMARQSTGSTSSSYQIPSRPLTSQQYDRPYGISNSVGPSQTYVPQQPVQPYFNRPSVTQYNLPPRPFARSGIFAEPTSRVTRSYSRSSYDKWRDQQNYLSRSYRKPSTRPEVPNRAPSSLPAEQPRRIIQLRSPNKAEKQVVESKQAPVPKQEAIKPLPIEKPPAPEQIVKPQMPIEPDPGAFQFPASEPVVSTPVTPPKTESAPLATEPTEPSTFVPQPTEPAPFTVKQAGPAPLATEPTEPSTFVPQPTEPAPIAAKQAEPSPLATEPSPLTPEKIEPPVPSTFAPPKSDFVPTPPASNQFKVNLDVQENPVPTFAPPKLPSNELTKKVEPKFQPKPVQEDSFFEKVPAQPKLNNDFSHSNKRTGNQFVPSTPKPRFENVPKTPKSEKIKFESLDQQTATRKTDLILEKDAARKKGWSTALAWILIPLLGLIGLGFLLKKLKGSNQSEWYREHQNEEVQYSKPTRYQEYEGRDDERAVRTAPEVSRGKSNLNQPLKVQPVESSLESSNSVDVVESAPVLSQASKTNPAAFEKARSRFESDEIGNLVAESNTSIDRVENSGKPTVCSTETSRSRTSCDTNLESCCNGKTGCENDCDDLTFIHGIDEETQKALYSAGYYRFSQLANADEVDLKRALVNSNIEYRNSNTRTWKALAEKAAMLPQFRRTGESPTGSNRVTTSQTEKSEVRSKVPVVNKAVEKPVAQKPVAKKQIVEEQSDNLTRLRGIDSAAAKVLRESGILSYKQLYEAGPARLASIFSSAGPKFASIDTSQWTAQSKFALDNDWVGLNKWWHDNPVEQTDTKKQEMPAQKPIDTKPAQTPVSTSGNSSGGVDDLTLIKGIGSATKRHLKKHGITSYAHIAESTTDRFEEVFRDTGNRFQTLNFETWAEQAKALMASGGTVSTGFVSGLANISSTLPSTTTGG